ncbi:OLC1v1018739C1 [Oldenlandia corymbosa var. corymbosa]|uniref:OLC1v1018739C1 n=1 Tax=Oldenlandia corymbosa var. corymbosa TaxID=529605 RepID=A0AAV1ECN2_OLDCO|nr:OLC1v1018739C1 [Oldenlandia corymbosa var. corymbosa]
MDSNLHFMLILLMIIPLFLLLVVGKRTHNRLPPGSMGLPLVGQTIALMKAMKAKKGEEWLVESLRKYGLISKLGLFGKPPSFMVQQPTSFCTLVMETRSKINNRHRLEGFLAKEIS